MLIPFFFLRVKQERWIIFFYIALALILYSPFNADILGYDTLSIFINTLLFSLTALYLRTGRMYLISVYQPIWLQHGFVEVLLLTPTLSVCFRYFRSKGKKYWLILAAVLIPFSVLIKVFGVYEDKNLMALDEEVKLEKLFPIHTNSEWSNFLKDIDTTVQNLTAQGVEVFFYGDKAHIFHYLYPETSLYLSSFFQPVNDLVFFDEIEKVLCGKESVALFVVNSYPENSTSPLSLLELEVINNGFEKVEDGKVRFYLRN